MSASVAPVTPIGKKVIFPVLQKIQNGRTTANTRGSNRQCKHRVTQSIGSFKSSQQLNTTNHRYKKSAFQLPRQSNIDLLASELARQAETKVQKQSDYLDISKSKNLVAVRRSNLDSLPVTYESKRTPGMQLNRMS